MENRRFAAALAFILSVAIGGGARAQNAPAAEALFAEGKELMKAGRYQEACPKLAASLKLDRTVGTLMNLADLAAHLNSLTPRSRGKR